MKIYRAFLPFLLTLFVSTALFWSAAHFYPATTDEENAPLPKMMPALTPAEAARVAQNRFPTGQVQGITLENAEENYYYTVTINTPEKGAYQVQVALADGRVHAVTALKDKTAALSLQELAERIHDAYPAAQFASVAIKNDDYFSLCQAELWQDNTTITLSVQTADGLILKEQRTPDDGQGRHMAYEPFAQWLALAGDALPDRTCMSLVLLDGERYSATYQDEAYRYELLLDSQGSELKRQITPLTKENIQPVE